MKQLIFILATLCISNLLSAQKKFEGIVTYRLHASAGEKQDAELKVFFGKMKLKVLFKEREEYDKDALVIRFDSGAVYNVNFEEKTFRKNNLVLTAPAQKPQKKLINGYSTTPYSPENNGLSSILGGMISSTNATFYLADSLYYYIPSAFAGNKELIMIQQNRIVLGAEIQYSIPFRNENDSSSNKPDIVTADAIEIKPMVIDENEFVIPVDFVNREDIKYEDEPLATDTTVVMVDSIAVPPPSTRKTTKSRPAKPAVPKSKTSTKPAARKQE